MRGFLKSFFVISAGFLSMTACSTGSSVVSGDLVLNVGEDMEVSISTTLSDRPLAVGPADMCEIEIEGRELDFKLADISRHRVNDSFGKGVEYVFTGRTDDGLFVEEMHFGVYDRFPSTIMTKVVWKNLPTRRFL